MTLVIFTGNTKSTVPLKHKNIEKIELIKVNNDSESSTEPKKKIKPKSNRKFKKLSKENQEFLEQLKIGSGFKIIPKVKKIKEK